MYLKNLTALTRPILGIRSSFLTPVDALLVSLNSPNILVLFSKSDNTDELPRLVLCAKAKGAFLVGNSLASSTSEESAASISWTTRSSLRSYSTLLESSCFNLLKVSEKELSKVSVRFSSKNASLNNQLPSEVGRSCLMLGFFLVGNSLAAICNMNVPSNASLDSQGEKSSPTPRTTEYLSTTELNPIPTARKMIDMWKKNHNAFGILYSWFLAKVSSQLELFPGAEFRVAYDEAMKCGAKVVLGDSSDSTVKLEWGVMYKIALGAAKGLQYLHEGCQRRINQ
ncbi:hypothetical protein OROMI_008481 [Orobanche minor]